MGLAISKQIIKSHKGEIWAENIPSTPPVSTTSIVEVYTLLDLTADTTVSGSQSWYAADGLGDRLRDWISQPKSTGYESLHITVMGPKGRWIEIQIRSERMDEIAEKGYAAHFKYKHGRDKESGLESWLNKLKETLENPDINAVDFVEQFKLNLYSKEIYVFTPNGDIKSLPKGSIPIDFAFSIHTEIGMKCRGARVNGKLVPLSHELKSGDQVEILTSKKQRPKEDWLSLVVTASARQKIKNALKEEKKQKKK